VRQDCAARSYRSPLPTWVGAANSNISALHPNETVKALNALISEGDRSSTSQGAHESCVGGKAVGQGKNRTEPSGTGAFRISAENFDESYYLQKNPDVATAILVGEFTTAYDHYMNHGWREQRPYRVHGDTPLNRVILTGISPSVAQTGAAVPASFIEAMVLSRRGGIFLVGWVDDRVHALDQIELITDAWRLMLDRTALARVRRKDVEQALGSSGEHAFGFWSVLFADQALREVLSASIRLCFEGGIERTEQIQVRLVSDNELRETSLGYLARSEYFGNPFVEVVKRLEPFIGSELVRLNQAISKEIVAAPYVERFGPQRRLNGVTCPK
jgi:hypothetical protein